MWGIICWNRWRNVEVSAIFHTRYHKIDKTTTITAKRCVNELVSPRTIGHLIEKKYQVTGLRGVQNCTFGEFAIVE